MRKTFNSETFQGYLFDHKLAIKTVQNKQSNNFGKEFINGTLDIATDDELLNVVTINFTYVTPVTKAGAANATYNALKYIIENGKSAVMEGIENATKVKVNTSIGLNDFYTNRDGEEHLVSAKRNDGGFVSIIQKFDNGPRNHFKIDLLINGTRLVEANPDRGETDDYLVVKGAAFNFRNDLLPVEFVCMNKGGISFFESLEVSDKNLYFTKVEGSVINKVFKIKTEEEVAFGEPIVHETERTSKFWVIETCSKIPYEIGDTKADECDISKEEIEEAIQNRNTYLADVKRRQDEYQASRVAAAATPASPSVATASAAVGGFNF